MIQYYFIPWIFVHRTFNLELGLIYMSIYTGIFMRNALFWVMHGANSGTFLLTFQDNLLVPRVGKNLPLPTA
jgi:hypothetical protein